MVRCWSVLSGENVGKEGRMWVGMGGDESVIGWEVMNVDVGVCREERMEDWGVGVGVERVVWGREKGVRCVWGGRGMVRIWVRWGILWVFLCVFFCEMWLFGRFSWFFCFDMCVFRVLMWICRDVVVFVWN